MGGQNSKEDFGGLDGEKKKKKRGGIMNCQCGKGRDDNDEVEADGRGGNGTRLTEEEWAKVKTGKMQGIPGAPDLLAEEAVSSHRRHRKRRDEEPDETQALNGGATGPSSNAHPAPASSGSHLHLPNDQSAGPRFSVGDRVRCACTRWCAPCQPSCSDWLACAALSRALSPPLA